MIVSGDSSLVVVVVLRPGCRNLDLVRMDLDDRIVRAYTHRDLFAMVDDRCRPDNHHASSSVHHTQPASSHSSPALFLLLSVSDPHFLPVCVPSLYSPYYPSAPLRADSPTAPSYSYEKDEDAGYLRRVGRQCDLAVCQSLCLWLYHRSPVPVRESHPWWLATAYGLMRERCGNGCTRPVRTSAPQTEIQERFRADSAAT